MAGQALSPQREPAWGPRSQLSPATLRPPPTFRPAHLSPREAFYMVVAQAAGRMGIPMPPIPESTSAEVEVDMGPFREPVVLAERMVLANGGSRSSHQGQVAGPSDQPGRHRHHSCPSLAVSSATGGRRQGSLPLRRSWQHASHPSLWERGASSFELTKISAWPSVRTAHFDWPPRLVQPIQ